MATNPSYVVSSVTQPMTLSTSLNACANGKLYVGKKNTDPLIESNRITVYAEQTGGGFVAVPQPISLDKAGYPIYNGVIFKPVTEEIYSLRVNDAYDVTQFYIAASGKFDPDQLSRQLSDTSGYRVIGKCPGIAELRLLDPTRDGECVLLDKYDSRMSHTAGGGELRYNASITDANVVTKNLDVLVFKTTSGKYYERNDSPAITPYTAGAWGDWDVIAQTGHDDTAAINRAIKAAQSTPTFFNGTTLTGVLGNFVMRDQRAGNVFGVSGTIEINPALVKVDLGGAVIDFRKAPYGTATTPRVCLLFVNDIEVSNHQVTHHILPRIMGAFDQTNHSYHVLVGFETRGNVSTGFRMKLSEGILEGGWRGVSTAKSHFYYFTLDTVSIDHCSDYAFYGYIETDSGEENVLENCKFFQSEKLALLQNGVWHCRNCSFVYPYGGDLLVSPSGYVNLDSCFFECYQRSPGFMIRQAGGYYPSVVKHLNTRFVKIKSVVGETMANVAPFYCGVGAANYGDGAEFDKVWQIDGVTDELRLATALGSGAGGRCVLVNTKVPSVLANENNAKWSYPAALVPSANVTKQGAIDNAFMGSTNSDFNQSGGYLNLVVLGQTGVVGAQSTYSNVSRGWTENGSQVATLVHNANGLVFTVLAGGTQTYSAIVGVLPSDELSAYLPQVTYTSTAEFTLTLYYVKTTKQFSNGENLDPIAVRILSQGPVVTLPVRSTVDTLPNVSPFTEGVFYGGIKGSAQASHVLMCINSKTPGSTFTLKNGSFVTI